MTKFLLIIAAISIPIYANIACSQHKPNSQHTKKTKLDTLQQQIMALHDNIMPQMSTIVNLRSQTNTIIDSLKPLKNQNQAIDSLQNNIQALNQADTQMMEWMYQYNEKSKKFDETDSTQLQKMLDYQLNAIIYVKNTMKESIDLSNKHLQKYNTKTNK